VELPHKLNIFTPNTITEREALRLHLEEVRRLGYAIDDQEFDLGVRCIAVPVFDFRGKAVASIGISGPATRITLERLPELARIVLEVGKALSERMNFSR
jgi:DNA-binding IclR family transcriptional regulator